MTDSPFSGGGSIQTPQDQNTTHTQGAQQFLDLLNSRVVGRYIIDPEGMKIEMCFRLDGTVLIKSNEKELNLTYING